MSSARRRIVRDCDKADSYLFYRVSGTKEKYSCEALMCGNKESYLRASSFVHKG